MKGLSIRWKITLWFAAALILMATLTEIFVLTISETMLQKSIKENLIEIVENNVDEVEFFETEAVTEQDADGDLYLEYRDGYLEIDDDYLNIVNGIYTALYEENQTLLYGENPVSKATKNLPFEDRKIQTVTYNHAKYYIYDCQLKGENLEQMWLRGIVSETHGTEPVRFVARLSLILLPTFCLLTVLGGYWFADRSLKPVKQIQATVDDILEGDDLTRRIHIGKGNDELHRLANTFDEMFDHIENTFEMQKKFTSDASHELRTPIAVILSQCEYSLEEPQTQEEYIEALELIERQGQKMSSMVNELLTVTRLEQNKEKFKPEPVNLSELTSSVCEDMALIRDKGITLESHIEPDILVQGDATLLTKLLSNLITNAYRYGKPEGHIHVSLAQIDGEIQLSVEDDGIGISEEDLTRIWNRFYQADSSRGNEGSGLGLSIVKEIASLHGGKMTVESTPGKGSLFIFHLRKN